MSSNRSAVTANGTARAGAAPDQVAQPFGDPNRQHVDVADDDRGVGLAEFGRPQSQPRLHVGRRGRTGRQDAVARIGVARGLGEQCGPARAGLADRGDDAAGRHACSARATAAFHASDSVVQRPRARLEPRHLDAEHLAPRRRPRDSPCDRASISAVVLLAADRASASSRSLDDRDQVVRLTLPSSRPDAGRAPARPRR